MRIRLWAAASSAVLIAALTGVAALAQVSVGSVTIEEPTPGTTITPGQSLRVRWSGGDPDWTMRLYVIDIRKNAVVSGDSIENQPNTGGVIFRMPSNLDCGSVYKVYVEKTDKTAYSYSGDLTAGGCQAPPPSPPPPPETAMRYCGTFHNETYNVSERGEVDVAPGGGFSGEVQIGAKLFGSGSFTGTMAGGQCGATTTGTLRFSGACPAGGEFNARYTIAGQTGTMTMSSGQCAPNGGSPLQPPPQPALSPPPPPPPAPPPPATAMRYCGTFHNETYNISETGEVDVAAGGGFSGEVQIGAKLYGSGAFTGTMAGGQCSATTTGTLQFSGACPAGGVFNARYTITGQTGTMTMDAANCR